MNTYDLAKKNYERNLWTIEMLQSLVNKGKLTQAELEEITKED